MMYVYEVLGALLQTQNPHHTCKALRISQKTVQLFLTQRVPNSLEHALPPHPALTRIGRLWKEGIVPIHFQRILKGAHVSAWAGAFPRGQFQMDAAGKDTTVTAKAEWTRAAESCMRLSAQVQFGKGGNQALPTGAGVTSLTAGTMPTTWAAAPSCRETTFLVQTQTHLRLGA